MAVTNTTGAVNYMEVEALFGVDGYVLVMANWKSSKCHNDPTAFNGGGGAGNDYNDFSGAGDFIQFEEISLSSKI